MQYRIYIITNTENNKNYIGYTSKTLDERLKKHLSYGNEYNFKFRRALRKYKPENFNISLLEECETKEIALQKEIEYIKKYDTYNNGYNSTKGGESAPSIGRSTWNENSAKKFLESRQKWLDSPEGEAFKKRKREDFLKLKPHQFATPDSKRRSKEGRKKWLESDDGKLLRAKYAENMKKVQKIRHNGIFELIDPGDSVHIINDIMLFCKEHNLSYHSFYYSLKLSKKDKENMNGKNKGWRIVRWNDKS